MKFYEAVLSSAAFRVRIALALKDLKYESVIFDLRKNQHLTEDYRKHNPMRSVPTIEDGGLEIFESMAICEYLEEKYPSPPLLPADSAGRARVRSMCQVVACDIHPLNNLRVLRYLSRDLHADEAARDEWGRHWIREGFDALERMLPESGFCHGATPTLADCFLVPQVVNAARVKLELTPWPRVQRIFDACMKLPAFERSHPKNHPGTH
jgi:maleylacetoacetate isomerase